MVRRVGFVVHTRSTPDLTFGGERSLDCKDQSSSREGTALLDQKWFTPATLIAEIEYRTGVRLKTDTLAKWRTLGSGPKFLKIARNGIAYTSDDVEAWLKSLKETKNGSKAQGTSRTGRVLALPNRPEGVARVQRQQGLVATRQNVKAALKIRNNALGEMSVNASKRANPIGFPEAAG